MISISGLSPNVAYWRLLCLAVSGKLPVTSSRGGDMIDLGHVVVELDRGERLCLLPSRGINPAFCLVEAAWVIAGRNDLAPLQKIIRDYYKFSDDGSTLNGAYGHRLRSRFGVDQLDEAIALLRSDPNSRRTVLSLYEAKDLGYDSKDIPCNTQIVLRIEDGRLAMTVFNRSNDLWLGVPYNWFVFRVLQTFVAKQLQIDIGYQRHVSTCMHLYVKDFDAARKATLESSGESLIRLEQRTEPLDLETVIADADRLSQASFDHLNSQYLTDFFRRFDEAREAPVIKERDNLIARAAPERALDVALSNWLKVNRSKKEVTVTNSPLQETAERPARTQIQDWVTAGTPMSELTDQFKVAAEKLQPFMQDLLCRDLPFGVRPQVSEDDAQATCQHLALEVILGCLDPLLAGSHIGLALRQRLEQLQHALSLPQQAIRARQVSDEILHRVFGDVIR